MKKLRLTLIILLYVLAARSSGTLEMLIAAGDSAYECGSFDEAIRHYRLVLDSYTKGQKSASMGDGFNRAGNACMNTGRYAEALEFYTTGIMVSQARRDSRLYRDLLSNVGIVFGVFKDYEQAISYFEKAFALARQQRDSYLMGVTIVNLAIAQSKVGNLGELHNYMELQRHYPLDDAALQQFFLSYVSSIEATLRNDPHKGIDYLHRAIKIIKDNGLSPTLKADVYNEMANAYMQLAERDSAIDCYRMTTAIAREGHLQEQGRDAYQGLERIYMLRGEEDSALSCQSAYIELIDSFFNQRKFNLVKNKLARFEEQVNDKQIARLDYRISQQRILIGAISMLLLAAACFAVVIFCYNRRLRAAYKMLVSKHSELIRQQEETKLLRDDYLRLNSEGKSTENTDSIGDFAGSEQWKEESDRPADMPLLSKERREHLLKDISEVMDNVDVISDPEFSLHTLAKMVDSNTKYVSMVINDTYNKNFKTYLNEYRIREACRRFSQPEKYGNLTISAIAADLGYNSANSFIIAFKKIIGMTPSVYVKLLKTKND